MSDAIVTHILLDVNPIDVASEFIELIRKAVPIDVFTKSKNAESDSGSPDFHTCTNCGKSFFGEDLSTCPECDAPLRPLPPDDTS